MTAMGMMRIWHVWASVVLSVALCLAVTSCGSDRRDRAPKPPREKVAAEPASPGEVPGEARAILIDGRGDVIYVGGFARADGDEDLAWRIARWRTGDDGAGWAFDADTVIWSDPGERNDCMFCIAMGDDGSLYGGGYDSAEGDCRWRVEKWDSRTGERVRAFGVEGVVATNAGPGDDYVSALAFVGGEEGALVLAGCDCPVVAEEGRLGSGRDDRSSDDAWRIEKRRASDGALVEGFGVGGVIRVDPSPFNDEINGLVVDPERGHLFLAGWDRAFGRNDRQWRLEKRRLDTGALVEAFGAAGVIQENPSSLNDVPVSMVADTSGGFLYVSGWDNSPGSKRWRIEKRRMSDGGLVEGFGHGGVLAFDPTDDNDVPKAITLDAPSGILYIGGVTRPPEGEHWRIEKRRAVDGTLVAEFGHGGVLEVNPSSGNDEIRALALHAPSGVLWAAGFQRRNKESFWCVQGRRASDGAPVAGSAR